MLGANLCLKKSTTQHHLFFYISLFAIILILISHLHVSALPAHLNFLRGRKKVVWCGHDPGVCLDPYKNPWGGPTCCFQRYCKDTLNDPYHCGSCGRVCGFGLVCCGGICVDTTNNPLHCGACFEVCPRENSCSYSMCDYGA